MKPNFVEHLVCPNCNGPLNLEIQETEHDQIRTGTLQCVIKGCTFPITNFVPRFVDADLYADSFSLQRLYVRKHFRYYQQDQSGYERFFSTTGYNSSDLGHGLTLEVGCGYGRFVNVVHHFGGEIVGIDLSTHSIELAQDFIGLKENVHLVQCDLFHLPFRKEHFERIFSIGVLHHTPNTRKAFEAIVPYLRQCGQISIWVYPPEPKISSNRWRKITTKLPRRTLYGLCILNQILFSYIRALPGGWRFGRLIPGDRPAKGRHFWMRVLSDFDDLSPRYAHVHTFEEVQKWFLAMGLSDITELDRPTSVTGFRL